MPLRAGSKKQIDNYQLFVHLLRTKRGKAVKLKRALEESKRSVSALRRLRKTHSFCERSQPEGRQTEGERLKSYEMFYMYPFRHS